MSGLIDLAGLDDASQSVYKVTSVATNRTPTRGKRYFLNAMRTGTNAADTLTEPALLLGVLLKQSGT